MTETTPTPPKKTYPGELKDLLDRAHARHLSALKALATVQKLLKPALSALELIATPVTEARVEGVAGRRRSAANPAHGVPVPN